MALQLFYAPRTRAFTTLWLLEELGVPYELESFDAETGRHKRPDYLALNPMGKIPLVVHDGVPISETGAIAIYLSDRFGRLAPAIDDPRRPAFLRWIFFVAGVFEPALAQKFFKWEVPSRTVAWGSFEQMVEVLREGVDVPQWLLGDTFTAADVVVGAAARFGITFGAFEDTGPIADYVARLTAREGFVRANAIETREGERFPRAQ